MQYSHSVVYNKDRCRVSTSSDNRNKSERFFRKYRIRYEVPIIGTSGNPAACAVFMVTLFHLNGGTVALGSEHGSDALIDSN